MDLIRREGVNWIQLTFSGVYRWAVVKTIMKLLVVVRGEEFHYQLSYCVNRIIKKVYAVCSLPILYFEKNCISFVVSDSTRSVSMP
jgi:hypothetical protein